MSASEAISLGLSAIAIYIAWRAYHRDEPKIKFTEFDFEVADNDIRNSQLVVSIVNVGGRGVMIERSQLRLKSGKTINRIMQHVPDKPGGALPLSSARYFDSPYDLQPGKRLRSRFQVYNMDTSETPYRFFLDYHPQDAKEVAFIDTAGKEYRKKVPRALKRRISHQWPQEIEAVRS